MKSSFLICLFVSLLCGGSAFFASNSPIVGLIVSLVFILVLSLTVVPMIERFKAKERRRHELFHFINSFIITLSVSDSLDMAYNSALQGQGEELTALNASISGLSTMEKIEYLDSYFQATIYRMFVSTLSIFQDQGGDIVRLAGDLLAELTRIEETENDVIALNRKNLLQFVLLWSMSLAITVFLRFGLSNFYDTLQGNVSFLACLGLFFFLMLGSIVIYISFYTDEKLSFKKSEKEKLREVDA